MPRTFVQGLAFVLGVWLAILLSPFGCRAAGAEGGGAGLGELEAIFHLTVNRERASRHLIALARRPELDRVARAHSADMARRSYLSHHSPEGLGPVDRLQEAALTGFSLAAENAGRTDEAEPNRAILEGWLASPEHRRNLHAPPFNATGVGIAKASDGSLYYTQIYLTYPRD
jgi:uncharacterized protein YkwD